MPRGSETFTLFLGDGFDQQVLSPQPRYLGSRESIGEREIDRLLGHGRDFGRGPLPTFLRLVLAARGAGDPLAAVLVAPRREDAAETEGESLAAPFDALAGECSRISTTRDGLPTAELRDLLRGLRGPSGDAAEDEALRGLRVLVAGCHTESRILAWCVFLRQVLRVERVAVCSQLVGSATQVAHLSALRHTLPSLGVEVLVDLREAALFAGLSPPIAQEFVGGSCDLQPAELRESLDEAERRLVLRLCLHWTRTELKPLAGGFSGSRLFLARGWKGGASTEPMVLKIDAFQQMRREMDGYYAVKDFLGKHVPTFGYPVVVRDLLGIGMELAAMEGQPSSLQAAFEAAESDAGIRYFLRRLEKALGLLVEKLYRNTQEGGWIVPYREFGLHIEQQQHWLRENAEYIQRYLLEAGRESLGFDPDQLTSFFALITSNEAGVPGERCLVHGDLNYSNIICDDGENVWFIDWTHCARQPVELDFAKLENDVKFVLESAFELEDLDRLRRFEDFLLTHRLPPDLEELPDEVRFVKWDIRFRKVLETVRILRRACFSLKASDEWLSYRVALLRYATHTLSFDSRRGRGECTTVQLAHALHSVDQLAFALLADEFHLSIRAERPDEYPERQRITIDEAPWELEAPDYHPPYYVAPSVLAHPRPHGWADPEDLDEMRAELARRPARYRDAEGRPLHPRGRTGLAGRGLLGSWGANLAVAPLAFRPRPEAGALEVLLGQPIGKTRLEIPKGFLLPGETAEHGLERVLENEAGFAPRGLIDELETDYVYDARQTDHAWVEMRAVLYFDAEGALPSVAVPGGDFEEIAWWPLDAETINRVPSSQARLLRLAIQRLRAGGQLGAAEAAALLEKTG